MYADANFAGLYNPQDEQDPVNIKTDLESCCIFDKFQLYGVLNFNLKFLHQHWKQKYETLSQAMRDLVSSKRLIAEPGDQMNDKQ